MNLGLGESKGNDVEKEVDTNYLTLRLIWLAFLVSAIAIFVVTRVVQPLQDAPGVLFWIVLAMGLSVFGASFFFKHTILKQAIEKRKLEMVRAAYIVAFAFCESIGLFGLLVHLVTGAENYYFFFVLSGFGILVHKPQRDDLLAASYTKKI